MKKQRSLDTELMDMIDNLYLLGRRMRMMENKPRRYGGDTPLFPNEEIGRASCRERVWLKV